MNEKGGTTFPETEVRSEKSEKERERERGRGGKAGKGRGWVVRWARSPGHHMVKSDKVKPCRERYAPLWA